MKHGLFQRPLLTTVSRLPYNRLPLLLNAIMLSILNNQQVESLCYASLNL